RRHPEPLSGGPDARDPVESEGPGGVLVEVPVSAAHVGPAVVDGRCHGPPTVEKCDLGTARQAGAGHTVVGMKTAGGVAAVVVPGGDCLAVDGDRPGACGGGAVDAVAGEANAQPVLPHATGCVAEL